MPLRWMRCARYKESVPKLFVEICQKPGRCGRRKHLYDRKRHQFSWKSDSLRPLSEKPGQELQKAGSPQHPHRYHESDQRRHDFQHRIKSVLRPLDKSLIDLYPLQYAGYQNRKNQKKGRCTERGIIQNPCSVLLCISSLYYTHSGSFL